MTTIDEITEETLQSVLKATETTGWTAGLDVAAHRLHEQELGELGEQRP